MILELEKAKLKRATEIDKHLLDMAKVEANERTDSHNTTQATVQKGDSAEGNVKWVRPLHSTASLIAAISYVFCVDTPDMTILGLLLSLPFTYSGLREFGKHSINKNALTK